MSLLEEPGLFVVSQKILWNASKSGDLAGVQRALAHGADKDAKEDGKYTAVYWAARNNRLAVLRFLLCAAQADPNIDAGSSDGDSSSGRDTPCFAACERHHHDAVRVLIAMGATPDHSTWTINSRGKCTCPHNIARRQ